MKFKNVTKKVINIKMDTWLAVEPGACIDLPEHIGIRQIGFRFEINAKNTSPAPKDTDKKEDKVIEESKKDNMSKSKKELKKMTVDELNDYAAVIGLFEVKSSMKKSDIIKKILKYQDEM